jgi:hypothetical protein
LESVFNFDKKRITFFSVEILAKSLNIALPILLPILISDKLYGTFAFAWSIDVVCSEVLGFGQNQYLLKTLNFSTLFEKIILITNSYVISIIGFIFLNFVLLVSFLIFDFSPFLSYFTLVSIFFNSVLTAIATNRLTYLRVTGSIIEYSKLRIVISIIKFLSFLLLLASIENSDYVGVCFILTATLTFIVLIFDNAIHNRIRFSVNFKKILLQFKGNLGVTFHVITGVLLVYFDKLSTVKYLTVSESGYYYFNITAVSSSFVFVNLLSMWKIPHAFSKGTNTKSVLKNFLIQSLVIVFIYVCCFHFLGIYILKKIYGPGFLLPYYSYTIIYVISILVVFQNYLHYLLLWKSLVYIEATVSILIMILVLLFLNLFSPTNTFDFLLIILAINLSQLVITYFIYETIQKR